MQTNTARWVYLVVFSMGAAGIWGTSCLDTSDLDPSGLKGKEANICDGVGDDLPCDDGNPCTVDACNASGLCEYTADDSLPPSPSANPCAQTICNNGKPMEVALPDETSCGTELLVCRSGTCVNTCKGDGDCPKDNHCFGESCFSCHDSIKNGDETGIDCGGAHCKKCNGGLCDATKDQCQSGFCVDGVCCEEACGAECFTCNTTNSQGKCLPIEAYQEDISFLCVINRRCDGRGKCKTLINGSCTGSEECLEGFCYTTPSIATCQLGNGDTCDSMSESNCFSDYCDPTGICKGAPKDHGCIYNDQCASGVCSGGAMKTCN